MAERWSATAAVSRQECIAHWGAPMSTPSSSIWEVGRFLAGNPRLAAYGAVDGGGAGVGHVFTVGVDFNYGAVAGNGMVSGILAGGIVGMEGVAVVGGDHER